MNGESGQIDVEEIIDRLLTVDMTKRGIITDLYEAAYEHHGGSPIGTAADRLEDAISEGDEVLIATGFRIAPTHVAESDGPIGAAALARALKDGLGAHPTILAEEEALEPIEAAARAYGLNVINDESARQTHSTCSVQPFPKDYEAAQQETDRLFDELEPSAVIALERVAANHLGEYHMSHGRNITEQSAKMEPLFEQDEALTVGIGDGGNELGMGTILDAVRESVPHAVDCGCGCGGGIAAEVPADVLVPTTVSNWGAHGIIAVLSTRNEQVRLHTSDDEERALYAGGAAGAIDGLSGRTDGTCDAMSPEIHGGIVNALHEIISDPPGRYQ